MQYLSPLTLFGESFLQSPDKKAIQLERKKLLADLELSGNESLLLYGVTLTKNDIICYCDELMQNDIAEYHLAIAKDLILLGFLQTGMLYPKDQFRNYELYRVPEFIQWITPYFSFSFRSSIEQCFKKRDRAGLSTLLNIRLLMTTTAIEQCWTYIERILTDNIEQLEGYASQRNRKERIYLDSVSHLMDFSYTSLIQLLPENRFNALKNTYAFTIMRACIQTFNYSIVNRDKAMTALQNAFTLATDPETRRSISAKQAEMDGIEHSRNNRKYSPTVIITVFLILLGSGIVSTFFGSGDATPGSNTTPPHTPVIDSASPPIPVHAPSPSPHHPSHSHP